MARSGVVAGVGPGAGPRVLHLTSSFPRWPDDAVAPYLADLARAQAGAGMEVHVLAPHDAGSATRERWEDIGVTRFRYAPAPWEVLAYRGGLLAGSSRARGKLLVPGLVASFAAAAVAEARRLRPDVLHAHWWLPAGVAGVAASLAGGLPLVLTLHGSDVHLASRPGWTAAARLVVGRAEQVVAVSEALAAEASSLLDLAPGTVGVARMPVPAALPAGMAVPGPDLAPLPAHPPLRLVAVGRLVREKGFDILVEAVHRLVGAGRDVRLVVIGAGPEAPALHGLAGGLGRRVEWLAPVPRAELPAHLVAAHALVAPSRREGLGLVALEAMACGRPVVASRVGGLVEAVDDGIDGLLVAPEDPEALAAALDRLPLPPPVGAALALHRPEAVAAAHLEFYRSAIGPPSPAPGRPAMGRPGASRPRR